MTIKCTKIVKFSQNYFLLVVFLKRDSIFPLTDPSFYLFDHLYQEPLTMCIMKEEIYSRMHRTLQGKINKYRAPFHLYDFKNTLKTLSRKAHFANTERELLVIGS